MREPIRSLAMAVVLVAFASSPVAGQRGDHKSEKVARTLSLAGTLVPTALDLVVRGGYLALFGATVGPSLGHVYANNGGRGALGTFGRGGVLAVGMLATLAPCGWDDCGGRQLRGTQIRAGVVGLIVVTWAAVDIVQAPRSARRYNAVHATAMIDWRPPGAAQAPAPVTGCAALCASLVRGQSSISLTRDHSRARAGHAAPVAFP